MIYTTFYDSDKCDEAVDTGKFVVSISRSEPKWLEVDAKFWDLAPAYALFHNRKLTNDEWEREYYKQLESKKNQVIDILHYLDKKDAVLCCWCNDYNTCHRYFLAKWAKQYNIQIKEL